MSQRIIATTRKLRTLRIFACLLLGGLVLLAVGAPAGAYPRTDEDLIETSCGDNQTTSILIAYDTIHGSTAEVAEFIGEDLCARGFKVDVRLAANVTDISPYSAVIVGSAIYQFAWLEGATTFLRQNEQALSTLPVAFFIVGASMAEDTPETREAVKQQFVDPVLQEFAAITPVSIGLFGGAVDFMANEYNFMERIVLRILGLFLGYTNSADWRNWNTIGDWIGEAAALLNGE